MLHSGTDSCSSLWPNFMGVVRSGSFRCRPPSRFGVVLSREANPGRLGFRFPGAGTTLLGFDVGSMSSEKSPGKVGCEG